MRAKSLPDLEGYRLIAGHPVLDFVNTVGGGRGFDPKEHLQSYAHLVAWSALVGFLERSQAVALAGLAQCGPEAAHQVLLRARELREALYRILTANAARQSPSPADLFLLSREAGLAMGRARLVSAKGHFHWEWPEPGNEPDRALWPVARAAAELVTSEALAWAKECGGDTCTWVFLDTSKNHSRRWCDMRDCGNRAKVRRFRKRG